MQLPDFICRCSKIGDIMTESKKKGELSVTCQSYLKEWFSSQLTGNQKEFGNKFTDKGILVEDQAIEFASEVLGWGFALKNTERRTNNILTGEADIILKDRVIDIKSSWNEFSFPLFEKNIPTKGYDWQLQGYMALFDKPHAQLVYCLMDAPEKIIEKEVRSKIYEFGVDREDFNDQDWIEELIEETKSRLTFFNLPNAYRVKTFDIERDDEKIAAIHQRVKECRIWIQNNLIPILEEQKQKYSLKTA